VGETGGKRCDTFAGVGCPARGEGGRIIAAERLVIYDDRCGFCRRSAGLLRALDVTRRHCYRGSSAPEALEQAGVTAEDAARELKLAAGGRLWGGYDAVVEILRALPLTFWLAPLLALAPVRRLGRRAYRWFAARRHCRYPGCR